ncbi:hypothetical protein JCM10450v2_005356 [Rhodotorula kratochvilovae]
MPSSEFLPTSPVDVDDGDDEADVFTLISSDGKSFEVDAKLLVAGSQRFADIAFDLGERDEPSECTLAEDSRTVGTFVAAIEDGVRPDTQANWLILSRMKDKYGCSALSRELIIRGWEVIKSDPLYAYGAGALLADQGLMSSAAEGCVDIDLAQEEDEHNLLFKQSPELAQFRLKNHQLAHRDAVHHALMQSPLDPSWNCHCLRWRDEPREFEDTANYVWNECASKVLDRNEGIVDPVSAMKDALWRKSRRWSRCRDCEDEIQDYLTRLQAFWEERKAKISLF